MLPTFSGGLSGTDDEDRYDEVAERATRGY
jgi:hypothetical protein